ncbi:MAG: hypothetical protein H6704_18520 [Myxococcales bacterium]|nr:hypothetical protein [Myxococcales bacterium]
MRVTCDRCGSPEERAGLDAVAGGFGFVCGVCDAVNVLAPVMAEPARQDAAAAPPSAADQGADLAPGEIACPKCGHVQRALDACHACGLVFAKVDAELARKFARDPLEGHPAGARIRARWAELAGDLDDEEGHRGFIRLCAETDLLEYAGQCYRRLTPPGQPEDPRVAAYRQRVLTAAMAAVGRLERKQTTHDSGKLRSLIALTFGALILLGFAVGLYLLSRYQKYWQANG